MTTQITPARVEGTLDPLLDAVTVERRGWRVRMTIKDVIEHLQTMPPDMEVLATWDESGEYWPATEPQGRVDWVHQETRTGGRTRWECSYEEGKGKPVCVLLSNVSNDVSEGSEAE